MLEPWGRDTWKAERDKEKANKVAQQVKRAAALTAELAAQSEEKIAAVCDRPPGLGELAGHIEAPNIGAGGSHPQATMMPDHGPEVAVPPRARPRSKLLLRRSPVSIRAEDPLLLQEGSVALGFDQPQELHRHVCEIPT